MTQPDNVSLASLLIVEEDPVSRRILEAVAEAEGYAVYV